MKKDDANRTAHPTKNVRAGRPTDNPDRVEAPVTIKAYLLCVFASFGGIYFGYDTGWMGGVLGKRCPN